jgi:hypothetical protein
MGTDKARNQERLYWRGPAAIYWTGLRLNTTGAKRVVKQFFKIDHDPPRTHIYEYFIMLLSS